MSIEVEKKRCGRCKVMLPLKSYDIKRDDEYYKHCKECIIYGKKNREKNKCEHNRVKYRCKDCGGNGICEHGERTTRCLICGGCEKCIHQVIKKTCKYCDIANCLKSNINRRMRQVLGYVDFEYLGCTIEEFMVHIEGMFKEGMCWENYGEWVMDHIKPVGVRGLTEEQIIERFEFTNIQPLWDHDNRIKYIN